MRDPLIHRLIFGGALMAAADDKGGTKPPATPPSPPPPPPGTTATADDDDAADQTMGGITISKVHGKTQFLALDANEDQVALIRKRAVDKAWSVKLYNFPAVEAGEFTSATAARSFVFGFYVGLTEAKGGKA